MANDRNDKQTSKNDGKSKGASDKKPETLKLIAKEPSMVSAGSASNRVYETDGRKVPRGTSDYTPDAK